MRLFKSEQAVIAEIHEAFDTAQERLLDEATRIIKSVGVVTNEQLAERLSKAGFARTPVQKGVKDSNETLVKTRGDAETIQYYKQTYPFLKFLTETELKRICAKYSLHIGPVENYIDDVPLKNLVDIENAQELKDKDLATDLKYCTLKRDGSWGWFGAGSHWYSTLSSEYARIPTRLDGMQFRTQYDACRWLNDNMGFEKDYPVKSVRNYSENRGGLFICAPISKFEGKNKRVTFIEVKDPIVFRYVRGGIQVITKWGLEASDPGLVNEIDN